MQATKVAAFKTRLHSTEATEALYAEISYKWQQRAKKLRARRWRKINRSDKGDGYAIN